MARTPHLSLPFRLAGNSFAVTEQDSSEEIADCVEAVLRTPDGTRIDAPEYGRPDTTFAQLGANASAEAYLAVVDEWEPRASVVGEATVEAEVERIVIKEAA